MSEVIQLESIEPLRREIDVAGRKVVVQEPTASMRFQAQQYATQRGVLDEAKFIHKLIELCIVSHEFTGDKKFFMALPTRLSDKIAEVIIDFLRPDEELKKKSQEPLESEKHSTDSQLE